MKALFLFLLAIFLLYSCKKEELKVCFSYTNDSIFVGDTVFFTNCTNESGTYFWDFGDSLSSAEENPYHIFQHTGEYNVTLTVNAMNQQNTVTKKIVVNERNITVCFSYSPDSIYENDTVFFQNCTNGTGVYLWDFGDNQTSSEKNPYHVYDTSGQYTVILNVNYFDSTFSTSQIITVLSTPINHENLIINTSVNTDKIVEVNQSAWSGPSSYSGSIILDLDDNDINDISFSSDYIDHIFTWYLYGTCDPVSDNVMVSFETVWDKYVTYSTITISNNGDTIINNFYETFIPGIEYPSNAVFDSILASYPAIHDQGHMLNNDCNWQSSSGILANDENNSPYGRQITTGIWRNRYGFLGIKMQDGDRTRFGWIEMSVSQDFYGTTITIYRYYLQD